MVFTGDVDQGLRVSAYINEFIKSVVAIAITLFNNVTLDRILFENFALTNSSEDLMIPIM